jgi:hypothetical protein
MIGQPPRLNNGSYDTHEQDRWFQDIYRYLKGLNTGFSGSGTTTVENVTKNYGSSSTNITETSKRYLRWFCC